MPQEADTSQSAISDVTDLDQIRVVLFINGRQVHVPIKSLLKELQAAVDDIDAELGDLPFISPYIETLLDDADAPTARSTLGLGTTDTPQFAAINLGHASDTTLTRSAAGKLAVEGVDVLRNADETLVAGYVGTGVNDGTKTTGTYTPSPAGGNLRYIINGGAFTLAAPAATGDFTLVVQITNNGSAGAISFSGFSKTGGDAFTTTNGHDFLVFVTKLNGFTLAQVAALQ